MQTIKTVIKEALKTNSPEAINLAYQLAQHPLAQFEPRPDFPDDQQTSFFNDEFNGITCVLSGTGAGKSVTASAKVATFLLTTSPPEPNTPFWIVSKTMDMVTSNVWGQNMSKFISPSQIQDIVWYRKASAAPRIVVLKPDKNGNSWIIEFKSFDMDRQSLQAANIAGFFADEQCPYDILMELLGRTRKWSYPGTRIYTLTPLEPDTKLEEIYQEPPNSWRFYKMSTLRNTTLNPDFVQQIRENELTELVDTRLFGTFAHFEGAIYRNFDLKKHVIEPFDIPKGWTRIRGLDLGWTHATAVVWAAISPDGTYYIYREYNKKQTSVEDHVREINDDWHTYPAAGNTYADSENPAILHEFRLRGLNTVNAIKDVRAGIARVQSLLRDKDGKPKLLIFNTCEQLIRAMRSYVFDRKTGKPKKESEDNLMDLPDSVRYMALSYKVMVEDKEVEYKPLDIQKKNTPWLEHTPKEEKGSIKDQLAREAELKAKQNAAVPQPFVMPKKKNVWL